MLTRGALLLLLAPFLLVREAGALPRPPIGEEDGSSKVGTQSTYDLNGVSIVPSYGAVEIQMGVRLATIDEDPDGTTLMQMTVLNAPRLVDNKGLQHSLTTAVGNVHKHCAGMSWLTDPHPSIRTAVAWLVTRPLT